MPACPGGARPKAGYTGTNLILDASKTALTDVIAVMTGFWGELAIQPLLGRVNTDNLCALNPVDPGPPTAADLVALSAMLAPFGSMQTATNVPTWFFNQVQYQAFQDACECITAGETIPPRRQVSGPSGAEPWPTDRDKQPQISRIEAYLTDNADASMQLYNGLQHTSSMLGDLYVRSVPALISNGVVIADHVTGEGCAELPIFSDPISAPFSPWATHVEVECHAIPPNTGIRGTLNPRLYGVGSLLFDANYSTNYAANITDRQSIHYWRQVMRLPARTQTYRICWRLMPGADVSLRVYTPNPDNVMYAGSMGDQYGWLPFRGPAPPNWTDPPIYPSPALGRRVFASAAPP
jgi:hypothetical protein